MNVIWLTNRAPVSLLALGMLVFGSACANDRAGTGPDGGIDGGGVFPGDAGPLDDAGFPPDSGNGPPGPPMEVVITSPPVGLISNDSTIPVVGTSVNSQTADSLLLSGVRAVLETSGDWSARYTVDRRNVVQSLEAELRRNSDRAIARDRVAVLSGDSTADGDFSEKSLALRLNDTALDALEPMIQELALGQVDLAAQIPVGTVLQDGECIDLGGGIGLPGGGITTHCKTTVVAPPPSFGSLAVDFDSRPEQVRIDLTIEDIEVNIQVEVDLGSGPELCDIKLEADTLNVFAPYELDPDPVDPNRVDVNAAAPATVFFTGFDNNARCEFLSGALPPELSLILQFLGIDFSPEDILLMAFLNVEQQATDALLDFLDDPDGPNGPEDSPVADGAEEAFADLSIGQAFGDAFSAVVDSPYYAIDEDNQGITFGMDTRAVSQSVAAGAPDLQASYENNTQPPALTDMTPTGQLYDIGLAFGPSFFNQLFKTLTESGDLNFEVSEFGGNQFNGGFLANLLPAYGKLPANEPIVVAISPTMAPLLPGAAGANGELAEVLAPHLLVDIRSATNGTVYNRLAIDLTMAFDLKVDAFTHALEPELVLPTNADDIKVFVLNNAIGADEQLIKGLVPSLLEAGLPGLAGQFGSFDLPEFGGLQLTPVGTARQGGFIAIYTNLTPAP